MMKNNKKIKKYIEFSDLDRLDKDQIVFVSRIEIIDKMAEMQIRGEQDGYKISIMRKTLDKMYSENDELIKPLAFVDMKVSEIKHVFSEKDLYRRNVMYICEPAPSSENNNDENEAE